MASSRTGSRFLQLAAVLVLILGVVVCLLTCAVAAALPSKSLESILRVVAPGAVALIAGVGLAAVLFGMSRLLSREIGVERDVSQSIEELNDSIAELRQRLDRPAAPSAAPTSQLDPQAFNRIVELLHELRDLSLLSEDDRRQRLAELHKRQESADAESFEKLRGQVEDLMSMSSWDQAHQLAKSFADQHPGDSNGQALLARVIRERDNLRDNTAQRMYEEVKRAVEHRQWRGAMAAAQRLFERFPGHPRAEKIRRQFKLIQDNAEIEVRQEQEQQIQDLIRNKRLPEAIALAEDLLKRFPLSPQAEAVEEMLPRLRDLAAGAELEAQA
jgi:hypothetical protein